MVTAFLKQRTGRIAQIQSHRGEDEKRNLDESTEQSVKHIQPPGEGLSSRAQIGYNSISTPTDAPLRRYVGFVPAQLSASVDLRQHEILILTLLSATRYGVGW